MWWNKVDWLIIDRGCLTSATAWTESLLEWRVQDRHGMGQILQRRTLAPLGHACQSGCSDLCLCLHVLYFFEVEEAGSSWPLECTTSLCLSPPHKQHHIIRNNILNSLSQSEHFMSCNETFWQLPPWPWAFPPSGCDGVSLLSNLWKGWHKHIIQYVRHSFTSII